MLLHNCHGFLKRLPSNIKICIRNRHLLVADLTFIDLNTQLGKMIFKEKICTNRIKCYTNYQLRCMGTKQHETNIDNIKNILDSIFHANLARLMLMPEILKTVLIDIFTDKWNATHDSKWRKKICKELLNEKWQKLYYNTDPANTKNIVQDCLKLYESDTTFLALKRLNIELPNQILEKFDPINVKIEAINWSDFYMAHQRGHILVTDEDFSDFFKRISTLLLELNVPIKEIDKYKFIFRKPLKLSLRRQYYDVNVKEIMDQGNAALEDEKYEEAINLYTEAILTSAGLDSAGAPNFILAQIYSNRSTAHRKLNNISSSEKDAERADYFLKLEFKQCETENDLNVCSDLSV